MKKPLALAALALTLTGCVGTTTATTPSKPIKQTVKVKMEAYKTFPTTTRKGALDATHGGITTTFNTSSGIEQYDFNMNMKSDDGHDYVQYSYWEGSPVSLQVQDTKGIGTVTCRISVDGVTLAESESSARYGIATCTTTARPTG